MFLSYLLSVLTNIKQPYIQMYEPIIKDEIKMEETEYKYSDMIVNFIKSKEGYSSKAYICAGGKLTIGWGSTFTDKGVPIKNTDIINKDEAENYLNYELNIINQELNKLELNLNQNQHDALISFIYNVGIPAFKRSTMLKLLKQRKYKEASDEFIKWDKITRKGKKISLPGLTKRRQEERKIFNNELKL